MSDQKPTVSHRLTALAAAVACAIAIILPMLTATGAQTPERDFTVDPALTQKSDSIAAEAMDAIQTDLPRAIGLLKECAAIERANLGPDHPYYANTLINLASAMIMAGHSDSAIVMSRQAAAIHQACYGTYSTEYADALSTYCLALHMSENLDSIKTSVRLRQQSIDICDHLGDTAMAALERFFKASDCLTLAQNTNDEAEKEALLCAGIESGRRATPSDNQREIMRALLQSRAMIYAKRNLSDQAFRLTIDEILANEQVALDCFSESLAYGGDSINIMGSHLRTGQALCNAGKYADAIGHLETVAGYMRNHSEYAANLVTTLGSLAVTYIKAGDFIKVMAIGDETESLVAQAGTYLSADAAGAFADIATALSGINEFDKAETFASKGLALAAAVKEQNPMPYLQLLTALAVINKERGNPTEAYNLYIECLDLAEASFPADHMAVVSMRNAMMAMMIDYSMPGWIPLFEKQKQVMAAAPQFSAAYAHMLSKAAKGYLALDIYDKALALNSEAINTLPDRENDSANFIELSLQKARILTRMHDYTKARAAVDTLLANQSLSLPQRITALETRYIINYDSRDLTSALDDISQCNKLYASLYGDPDNAAQIKSLSDMGTIYVNLGQYARADSVRRKAIEIAEKIYTKQSAPYLQALVELEMTPEFGNPYRQRDRQLEYLEFIGEHYGKNTAAYATQQMKSADILGKLGLRQQALTLAMEAIKTLEEYQGEQSQSFIGALVSAASHQYNAGLYDETIITATRAIDLTEKYHPQAAQRVVNAMGWLIEAHSSANDYGTAIYQGQRLVEYTESKFGRGSLQHTEALHRLAMQYMHLGNYETSSNLCREIIGLTEADNTITDESKDETVWNLLANNYQYQGRYNEALEIAQKLYDKYQNRTGIDFTVVSHNLAAAYNMMGRHQQALELSDAVMHSDGLALVDMPNMANIYLKNGKIIAMAGNKEQGLAMMRRGMEMRDSIYRGQGRYVLLGLNDLISVCDSTGDLAARDSYAMRLSTLTRDFVRQSFLTLPAKGRHAMWQQHSDFMLNRFAGYAADNPTPEMTAAAYDNLLLGKGLMLNTEREISDILKETDDPAVQQAYSDYLYDRHLFEQLQTADRSTIAVDVDSLARQIERHEFEMQKYCGDFTRPLAMTWRDVAGALGAGEAAVEFTTWHQPDGTERYIALVLHGGDKAPVLVNLPATDLGKIWRRSPADLSESLWKPMAESLAGATRIYFSPAGEIHSIPVETLPDWERPGELVADRWDMCRLSSTRELALARNEQPMVSATVYGGLHYDADPQAIEADSRRYALRNGTLSRDMGADPLEISAQDSTLRAGAAYLPGTLAEARTIHSSLASRMPQRTQLFTDTIGTETSFKALSGTGCSLVHVATHGFSWSPREASRMRKLSFLNFNDDAPIEPEDKALSRSGLLFAGANNALRGYAVPEGVDDGILSAREIASLDFRNLDLLVLSACETGLGEITGEGVFGLQRGFKKAGAGAIMMSLWKVDDNATRMLMTKFYEQLLAGKTKRQALAAAQRHVREYTVEATEATTATPETPESSDGDELTNSQKRRQQRLNAQATPAGGNDSAVADRPYESPRFWAGFILLDALK